MGGTQTAIGLAERCHATVTVITVADRPKYGYAAALSILAEGEFLDAELANKERLLGLAVGRIPNGLERESRVLTGDPAAGLQEVSGEFDLMVVGSRAWGPLKRTLLGSTTRKLIRSCACPVLVLPRGAGVDPLGVPSRPGRRTRFLLDRIGNRQDRDPWRRRACWCGRSRRTIGIVWLVPSRSSATTPFRRFLAPNWR